MGTCCTNDKNLDNSRASNHENNKTSFKANIDLQAPNPEQSNNKHAPENSVEIKKVSHMNTLNPKVESVMKKLGRYNPDTAPESSWSDLPEIGPYKYSNGGATYTGQYKNG